MQQWKNHIQIYSWLVIYSQLEDSDSSILNKGRGPSVALQPNLIWPVYRHNLKVLLQVNIHDEHHECFTQRMVLLSSLFWLCPSALQNTRFLIGYKINRLTMPLFLSLWKIFRKWWPISTVFFILCHVIFTRVWYNSPHILCFSAYPEIKGK